MTRAEFLSAVAKGQGRAISAVRDGRYRPSLRELRRLVWQWPGWDRQCEDSRGWYTVEIMEASGRGSELATVVVDSLGRRASSHDRGHRTDVVEELAKRGNTAAKQALYDHFAAADDFRMAQQIIRVDGLAGLDWVVSRSAGHLTFEERWRFKWWIEDIEEPVGLGPIFDWIEQNAARPEVAEFGRLVGQEQLCRPTKKRPKPSVPYEVLKAKIRRVKIRHVAVSRWMRSAPRAEIEKAWRDFETEQDFDWLFALGLGLRHKLRGANIDVLIERARTWSGHINPFVRMLEEIKNDRVRGFGQELISAGRAAEGLSLLASNARSGDEEVLLAAVNTLTEDWDIEYAGLDLMRLDEALITPEMLLWIYEQSPCSFCRESAVRDLIGRNQAPVWLLEECLLDCVADTRELARKSS